MSLPWAELLRRTAGEPAPFALVDVDAFDRNLERHLGVIDSSLPLRVATKSLRVRALIERLLARGQGRCRGMMCYSAREALELARVAHDDLFVAYPVVDERLLDAIAAERARGKLISVAVDSREGAERLARAGASQGTEMLAVLCVDMSLRPWGKRLHLGVRRSPLHDPEDALRLARHVRDLAGVRVHGVMGYEAQVAGLGDDSVFDPGLVRQAKRLIRIASMRDIATRRSELVAALEHDGFDLAFVNGGGTGSLDLTGRANGVTEVTAGSGFYKPLLFDGYRSAFVRSLEPAAFFVLEVTRKPARSLATCHGGGFVASGSAGPDKLPRPHWPPGLSLLSAEGVGEVQTPLSGAETLREGDRVVFRHAKAGELMERFDSILWARGGDVVERVPTYRGEGWSFG